MAEMTSTPYDSAKLLFGANIPTWLNANDANRLAAYQLYEDIYWTKPDVFKLQMRGTNEHPIYLPSGRIICNTINRYVARGFSWIPDPKKGTPEQRTVLTEAMDKLFKRERFRSQFKSNKLYGIIRGDAAWLVSGNINKQEGSRLSIRAIDPASVFWIEDPEDINRNIGVDLIEQLTTDTEEAKVYIKRQRWIKSDHPDHPAYNEETPVLGADIAYQVDSFELDGWETDEAKKFVLGESIPLEEIPGITNLPIYHWRNMEEPENPWGSSEMRGLETLFSSLNQAISDEDLALAIAGLGVYVTDAGAPVDDNDNPVAWGLGPAEVVEVGSGKTFNRISGVGSVDPSINHMEFVQDQAFRVQGAGDVAQGRVDVAMAESGIALRLRLGPIMDSAGEKDELIEDCMNQLFFDLCREWYPVYEGEDFGGDESGAVLICAFGDKLPEDKDARRRALFEGLSMQPPLFSQTFVWSELRRMGWEIPENMEVEIAAETEFYSAMEDQYGDRLNQEAAEVAEEV